MQQMQATMAELQAANQRLQQQMDAQAAAGAQAQGAAAAAAAAAAPQAGVLDTRVLGKPDYFDGASSKWADWAVVVRAYCTVLDEQMGELMDRTANLEHAPRNAVMTPGEVAKSKKLYYILMMLVRGQA